MIETSSISYYLYGTLMVIAAYLLGCINAAYLVTLKVKKTDIRQYGSGNAGATNVLRTFGLKSAAPVALFDVFKGFLAVKLSIVLFGNSSIFVLLCATAVVCGHNWPIFFNYRGGKGIAASLGAILAVSLQIGIILLIVAVILLLITHIMALSTTTAMLLSIYLVYLFGYPTVCIVMCAVLTAMSLYQHKENYKRILHGEENKIYLFKKKK